jgi:hypothetical protein
MRLECRSLPLPLITLRNNMKRDLAEKDIIEKQEQEYIVINPVIKYLLQEEIIRAE